MDNKARKHLIKHIDQAYLNKILIIDLNKINLNINKAGNARINTLNK